MESLDVLNNVVASFEAIDGILKDDSRTSDQNKEISLGENMKSTKDEFGDSTDIRDSEDNLVDVTPTENSTEVLCDNFNEHDAVTDDMKNRNTSIYKESFCELMKTSEIERNGEEILLSKSSKSPIFTGPVSSEIFDSTSDVCDNENEKLDSVSSKNFALPCETEKNGEEVLPSEDQKSPSVTGPVGYNLEMFDSTSDVYDNENEQLNRVSSKNFTLPCETEKNGEEVLSSERSKSPSFTDPEMFDSTSDMHDNGTEKLDRVSSKNFTLSSEIERNEEEILLSESLKSPQSAGPMSPDPEVFDSTSDIWANENEKLDRTSRKNFSLPYFQLPKPDLDEYLVQTNELLSGNKKDSLSSLKSVNEKCMSSKRKSVLDEFLANFPAEKDQLHIVNSPCNDKLTRTSISQEYSKVISCLGQLDESKSPGIKRIALKEFLQKKINEKKAAAFNRSKEISNLDENEEVYENDIVDGNEEDENREIEADVHVESGTESSDEDLEEPTVAFSFERQEKNVHNINEEERHSLSDDSDEDIVTVRRKPKILQILEEDSNDTSYADTDFNPDTEEKSIENNEKSFNSENGMLEEHLGSLSNGQSADTQIKMGFADIPSYQPAISLYTDADESSRDSLASETYKKENFKDSLNFNESNLSHNASPIPLSMDDPPLMLSGNAPLMGDIFLSQDLAAVCSGAFKKRDENSNPTLRKEEKHLKDDESEDEMKSINQDVFLKETDCDSDKDSPIEEEEKINDFLDLEAELSGEDDGVEDAESDGEGVGDLIAADHEVPSSAEIREEIVDLHLKHLIDDDEEILREYKEKFLDDGELHGDGRTRRFAWKNNAIDMDDPKNGMSSESDDEGPVDSWSSMNQEKAKWLEENREEELADNLNSSHKNLLKVKIIGKPEFSQTTVQNSSRRLSCKRPRGSFLHLDSASQVLKKLKASEDACGGSRTTKHFVFRNELSEEPNAVSKEVATTSGTGERTFAAPVSDNRSIFNKI